MKIVTGCDENMEWFTKHWLKNINEFGYDYTIYDLGGLGFGPKINVKKENLDYNTFPPCLFKPKIILRQLNRIEKNKLVIWLDIDAIIEDNISELKNDDFDLAFTRRRDTEINKFNDTIHGIINAGVCLFRNNSNVINFVNKWKELSEELNNDQKALNKMLINDINTENLNINYYSTDEYNNYYFDNTKGKIVHYKGGLKERLKKK